MRRVHFYGLFIPTMLKVSFLIGKSKTAPLKQALTISKLELIAAGLSIRLVEKVVNELSIKIDKAYYWVDAVSVLHLINDVDKRLKVFVANRFSLIYHYSEIRDRHYCPSSLNVADIGVNARSFLFTRFATVSNSRFQNLR